MNMVQRSDVGRVRTINEDLSWVQTLDNGHTLAIVADGMGGHQAGDTASRLAVATVTEQLQSLEADLTTEQLSEALTNAILRANRVIYELASQDMKYHNMGTTIVAVLLDGAAGVIGHIGDSRIYKVNNHSIEQLTEDHSLVNELLKSGQITDEEAEHHPRKNVLTRALGTDPDVSVEISTISFEPGEMLVLCSDGLSNRVSEEQMTATVFSSDYSLEDKADLLLQMALQAGGEDNITVVLLEQTEESAERTTGGETE
ncbi:serine/threonine protein phosphatase [Paenibacillus selenitireducens]|uniref:Serine/threonine protein phosphatase n=1 Tax=Paenibacillus selenitireducens TaxID=1324314 RepID=A0A1T2XFW7_9BACL|nr:Stp1/IreP family PP2C-type Ser/Thr phosphatase [Paenibacillus selenitireducens]OPA78781.1 serine/threonine protein phosphatase [Paenibacillus selenitireducens]